MRAVPAPLQQRLTHPTGELKHIHKLKFWPLHSVLQDKYLISEAEALQLEGFLQPMLNLVPDKRATAEEMLSHEWLSGVFVQGEIEVHLAKESAAERIEQGRLAAEGMGLDVNQGIVNAASVDPLLVHALKPVDALAMGVKDNPVPAPPPSATRLPPSHPSEPHAQVA